jgi:hypothetical protein
LGPLSPLISLPLSVSLSFLLPLPPNGKLTIETVRLECFRKLSKGSKITLSWAPLRKITKKSWLKILKIGQTVYKFRPCIV